MGERLTYSGYDWVLALTAAAHAPAELLHGDLEGERVTRLELGDAPLGRDLRDLVLLDLLDDVHCFSSLI